MLLLRLNDISKNEYVLWLFFRSPHLNFWTVKCNTSNKKGDTSYKLFSYSLDIHYNNVLLLSVKMVKKYLL